MTKKLNISKEVRDLICSAIKVDMKDQEIANNLNARGYKTCKGYPWVKGTISAYKSMMKKENGNGGGSNHIIRKELSIEIQNKMSDLFKSGKSDKEIANILNSSGIVTFCGKKWEAANVNWYRRKNRKIINPQIEKNIELPFFSNDIFHAIDKRMSIQYSFLS